MRVINGLIAAENNLELLLALATIRDTGKINYVRGYITWLVWNKDKKEKETSLFYQRDQPEIFHSLFWCPDLKI